MKLKGKDLQVAIQKELEQNQYIHANTLAKKFNVCNGTITNAIRKMREESDIGIHIVQQGYTLSENATKKDDVGFVRRLMGRRASDFFAMQAAQPYIAKRWSSLEDKNALKLLTSGLGGSATTINKGLTLLNEKSKALAILPRKKQVSA